MIVVVILLGRRGTTIGVVYDVWDVVASAITYIHAVVTSTNVILMSGEQ